VSELEDLLSDLQRLTALVAARENAPDFDEADQVAVRTAMQTLSSVAVHLRAEFAVTTSAMFGARDTLRRVERRVTAAAKGPARPKSELP
jgi:hypothetical protein